MSELPKGWVHGSFGDVLRIRNGYAFKSAEFKLDGVPLVRQSNLDGDKVNLSKCVYLDERYLTERAGFTLNKGDVLIGMSGSVGKLCTYDQDFVALQNQRVGKIELHIPDQTEWRFIWHYLKTVTDALLDKAKGVAVANVSPDDIHSLPLNIPPLAEQTRIAAKLDELLAQVDALKARIDGIPALLKRFRQSVLAAAVSGRLTEDWRKGNEGRPPSLSWPNAQPVPPAFEIPKSWAGVSLGSICKRVSVGHVGKTSEFYVSDGEGIPFLRSQNVRPGRVSLEGLAHISTQFDAKLKKSQLEEGDLLVVRVGANRGDACILPKIFEKANCANIVFARPPREISPYLNVYFQSPVARGLLLDETVGGAQGVINTSSVAGIFLALPTEQEQAEIVRRVEQLFAFADQLEAKVASAKSRIDHLTQSILAKAFRGELVPQDPNDEPASVLLERIKTQRATAPKAKRGRKASA